MIRKKILIPPKDMNYIPSTRLSLSHYALGKDQMVRAQGYVCISIYRCEGISRTRVAYA